MDTHRISAMLLAIGLFALQGCGGADSLNIGDVEDTHTVVEVNEPPIDNAQPVAEQTDAADQTDNGSYELIPVLRFIEPMWQADEFVEDAANARSDDGLVSDSGTVDKADPDAIENYQAEADKAKTDQIPLANVSADTTDDTSVDVIDDDGVATTDDADEQPADHVSPGSDDGPITTEWTDDEALTDDKLQADQESEVDREFQADSEQGSGLAAITDLLFLTGQSNAASLETAYDATLDAPDSRVYAYTDQGWRVADLHQFWDEGIPGNWAAEIDERDPYNNIIFQVGKSLARDANRTVGIVMLTAPGEGISHWDAEGEFYQRMREHAIASLNELPHKSAFDAVIWIQGETDWLWQGTADPDIPVDSYIAEDWLNYYPSKLNSLINALRGDAWFGDQARFICTETIKAALNPHLMALNNDGDERTGCALASDLEARDSDPHGNHFSGAALRILGQRIADVYLDLLR